MNNLRLKITVVLALLFFALAPCFAQKTQQKPEDKPFVVVIDAGHGGHDPGALGAKGQEKDINLAIALELGKKIEATCPDVKVYYTRKTDVFVTLQGRADFVNKHKADLFICVHTNSAKNASAHGVETFTLGLNKSESNLDVAMRENSVMLLESDYKTKYQGFNPNSVESYIMFEFMQDQYVDRSVEFASLVQNDFVKNAKRNDRGVRQAAFWVLHKSACPSVLIEVGFITNSEEERFLLSKDGRETMANSIYNAFMAYKRSVDRKSGKVVDQKDSKTEKQDKTDDAKSDNAEDRKKTQPDPVQQDTLAVDTASVQNPDAQTTTLAADVVYKIQFLTSPKQLKANAPELKGLPATFYVENGMYKYTTGATDDWQEIVRQSKQVKQKFSDAFIIAYIKGVKVSVTEAREYQKIQ